jgi:hypothetical protein
MILYSEQSLFPLLLHASRSYPAVPSGWLIYLIMDPQYKVGAAFDLLFRYRQGIGNTDQMERVAR